MRDFGNAKRIVVKIGTNTLSKATRIDTAYIGLVAGQVSSLLVQGKQVVIVTSGAIGMGAGQVLRRNDKSNETIDFRYANLLC